MNYFQESNRRIVPNNPRNRRTHSGMFPLRSVPVPHQIFKPTIGFGGRAILPGLIHQSRGMCFPTQQESSQTRREAALRFNQFAAKTGYLQQNSPRRFGDPYSIGPNLSGRYPMSNWGTSNPIFFEYRGPVSRNLRDTMVLKEFFHTKINSRLIKTPEFLEDSTKFEDAFLNISKSENMIHAIGSLLEPLKSNSGEQVTYFEINRLHDALRRLNSSLDPQKLAEIKTTSESNELIDKAFKEFFWTYDVVERGWGFDGRYSNRNLTATPEVLDVHRSNIMNFKKEIKDYVRAHSHVPRQVSPKFPSATSSREGADIYEILLAELDLRDPPLTNFYSNNYNQ